jgi:hypothetical protein
MLGRPTQVLLCIVPTKNGDCPNIVKENGKCAKHIKSEQTALAKQQQQEKQIERKKKELEESEEERKRIKNLIKTNPKIYQIKHDETFALNKANWIYNKISNYYGQFDQEGNVVIECECGACNGFNKLGKKQKENVHCIDCECYDCVCEARQLTGKYDPTAYTPHWDNPCHGSCESCKTYYE